MRNSVSHSSDRAKITPTGATEDRFKKHLPISTAINLSLGEALDYYRSFYWFIIFYAAGGIDLT